MIEEWRPIIGHETDYEVSNLGRVRSKDRVKIYARRDQYSGRNLTIQREHHGRILRPAPNESGHLTVVLGRRVGSQQVHRLVLETFVGPCPDGAECRHLDDNPADNRLSNLCWGTRSENLHDAVRNGKKPVGGRTWNAKLSEQDVYLIRAELQKGRGSVARMARLYGVNEVTIRQIKTGRTWRHLPCL